LWIKPGIKVDIHGYQNNTWLLHIYVVLKRVLKKKQISTSNCLEPDGSLKFFHPSKLGALFDSANFQIPGIEWRVCNTPPPTALFPTLVNTMVFFFGGKFLK
jgi:hypothetical protein